MAKYLDEAGVRKLWAKTKEKAGQAQSNAVTTAGNYAVNGKKISSNPTLSKSDVGLGNVTNEAQIPLSQKGAASGVATLGTDGKVPSSQLPSYVDDVLEYNGKSTFPETGETGKIYVDTSTNKTYRWSGTAYVEISASLALGETSSTAYAGDKGAELATKVSTLEDTVGKIPGMIITGVDVNTSLGPNDISIDVSRREMGFGNDGVLSIKLPVATSSAGGIMSTSDKTRLDKLSAIPSSKWGVVCDVLSATIMPDKFQLQIPFKNIDGVTKTQNFIIEAATTTNAGVMSAADKTKLGGISEGAEVNQNAFSRVTVGNINIDADSKTDALTLAAGSNITITPDATNDKITIAAQDTTYDVATTSANGLMSAADKTKLDSIVALTDAEIDAILV